MHDPYVYVLDPPANPLISKISQPTQKILHKILLLIAVSTKLASQHKIPIQDHPANLRIDQTNHKIPIQDHPANLCIDQTNHKIPVQDHPANLCIDQTSQPTQNFCARPSR